ncbi:MAG: nucleoside hydrolase [Phycisphaerales bacterium]|nr:nucleoside hydrolase [Phycisphaerales bacterium]
MRTKIILDTDIGDDVDDALALALIGASPELELLGVTTVFGNVVARGRQAQTILQIAGRVMGKLVKTPVAAGCSATMASRKGVGGAPKPDAAKMPGQAKASWPDAKLPPLDKRHGVDFLIETIMAGDGDIVPVTIGAMTNMAMALVKEPRIVKKIPRIVSMAAEFREPKAEWNIRCDPEAASLVFASGVQMDVIPFAVGKAGTMIAAEVGRFAECGREMGRYLAEAIALWRADHWMGASSQHMPSLFDPLAVAALIRPELFTWKQGTVEVELRGEKTYGYTTLTEAKSGENGPHRIAWELKREEAVKWFLDRICET